MANQYTLGKGKLYFAPFATGTEEPKGERFFGNVSEFNLTIEEEKLEHYASTGGIRQKDASISLQVNRSGSIVTDEISSDNLALFFFGSTSSLAVTGTTVTDEAISAVEQGRYYQLGVSDANPTGARELDVHTAPSTNVIVTDDGGSPVTFVEGDDYTIDMVLGRLFIVEGGAITDGTNLKVSYKTKTSTRERILSGGTAISGQLRFIADNPAGPNRDYLMPSVTISPSGDYALISEEWMTINLSAEILKKTGREAIYVDGRAMTA